MAEPLKNIYNPSFFESIIPVLQEVIPSFDERRFLFAVFDEHWPDLELKQRVRQISTGLHEVLPKHFPEAVPILKKLVASLGKRFREQNFQLIFLADYVEQYGIDYFPESMDVLTEVTILVSGEFAIRPFIKRYEEKTFRQLINWSKHANPNVRRLASEGSRPRLPWGMGVPVLKQRPELIMNILTNLKEDPSEYVRRSVANNLNDISKDHPNFMLEIVRKWYGKNPLTNAIIKHSCRSLIKKGNYDVLLLHGLSPEIKARLTHFSLSAEKIRIGKDLHFKLKLKSNENVPGKFRVDYAIEFQTSTGRVSRKVFKIKEGVVEPGEVLTFDRKQSFQNLTTRKHFKGKHSISIVVNGNLLGKKEFLLH